MSDSIPFLEQIKGLREKKVQLIKKIDDGIKKSDISTKVAEIFTQTENTIEATCNQRSSLKIIESDHETININIWKALSESKENNIKDIDFQSSISRSIITTQKRYNLMIEFQEQVKQTIKTTKVNPSDSIFIKQDSMSQLLDSLEAMLENCVIKSHEVANDLHRNNTQYSRPIPIKNSHSNGTSFWKERTKILKKRHKPLLSLRLFEDVYTDKDPDDNHQALSETIIGNRHDKELHGLARQKFVSPLKEALGGNTSDTALNQHCHMNVLDNVLYVDTEGMMRNRLEKVLEELRLKALDSERRRRESAEELRRPVSTDSIFGNAMRQIDSFDVNKVVRVVETPTMQPAAAETTQTTPGSNSSSAGHTKRTTRPTSSGAEQKTANAPIPPAKPPAEKEAAEDDRENDERSSRRKNSDPGKGLFAGNALGAKASDSASDAVPAGSEEAARQVREIYSKHNPGKLADIPQLLAKYAGKEQELLDKLHKKYGAAEQASSSQATPTSNKTSVSLFGNSAGSAPVSQSPFANTNNSNNVNTNVNVNTSAPQFSASSSLFSNNNTSTNTSTNTSSSIFANNNNNNNNNNTTSTSSISSGGQQQSFASRVTEIYTRHNPGKLGDVPQLLAKYAGKEQELLDKLHKKYNIQSTQTPTAASTSSTSLFGNNNTNTSSIFGNSNNSNSGASGNTPVTQSPFGNASTAGNGTPSLFGNRGNASASTPFSNAPANNINNSSTAFASPFSANNSNAATTSIFGNNNSNSNSLFAGNSNVTMNMPMPMPMNYGQRVLEIYTQHNPAKISEIPQLLQKYAGKEQELLERLHKKYNINTAATDGGAAGGLFGSPMNNPTNRSPFAASNTSANTPFSNNNNNNSLFGKSPQTPSVFSSNSNSGFGNNQSSGFGALSMQQGQGQGQGHNTGSSLFGNNNNNSKSLFGAGNSSLFR